MATSRKKDLFLQFIKVFITCFCLFANSNKVSCVGTDRTEHKMYIELATQSACFRNFNATHQVGCTSSENGNVGTVHYIQSIKDMEWVLNSGPHSPYVVVLKAANFTRDTVITLAQSSRVNGIMVINVHNSTHNPLPSDGFSSVDQCPNDRFGLYADDTNYNKCQKQIWNKVGTSLRFVDLKIPVFALSDIKDVDAVLNKCYFPFNNPINDTARDYPLCSAEVKARMDGAVNSVVCMRRTLRTTLSLSGPQQYCDPMGDFNVITFMQKIPSSSSRQASSVIMVATKLDSVAMFQNEYNAADTTVVGVVTLLAAAQALWKQKEELIQPHAKDIVFAFFQGETFDYIGSSRAVYDIQKGIFPQEYSSEDKNSVSKLNLTHIDQFVELNQVGLRDNSSLWAHVDPISQPNVEKKIEDMTKFIKTFGEQLNISIKSAASKLPLPPASAQRFLMARKDLPVVVLTDHEAEFTNKYYNSRFDTADKLGGFDYPEDANDTVKYNYITKQALLIANLSSTLARYLYNASTGKNPTAAVLQNLTADPLMVTRLLYCFLISPNCELFYESVDSDNAQSLKDAKQPFPFYVSVTSHTNEVTQLVYSLMARFTGTLIDSNKNDCKQDGNYKLFSFTWMQGALKNNSNDRQGWCYKAIVHYTKAVSPAFEIDEYDLTSGDYSSWTEARWGSKAIGIRLFLMPSPEFQLINLCIGVFTFLISLGLVFLISHADMFLLPGAELMPQS
ncbi:nicastrin [Biomphalaria glabrata]